MSSEAFLQRLKRCFEVCNYKSAPYTVLSMWNQRRALRFRKGGPLDEQDREWSSPAMAGIEMAQAAASSQVCAQQMIHRACVTSRPRVPDHTTTPPHHHTTTPQHHNTVTIPPSQRSTVKTYEFNCVKPVPAHSLRFPSPFTSPPRHRCHVYSLNNVTLSYMRVTC